MDQTSRRPNPIQSPLQAETAGQELRNGSELAQWEARARPAGPLALLPDLRALGLPAGSSPGSCLQATDLEGPLCPSHDFVRSRSCLQVTCCSAWPRAHWSEGTKPTALVQYGEALWSRWGVVLSVLMQRRNSWMGTLAFSVQGSEWSRREDLTQWDGSQRSGLWEGA